MFFKSATALSLVLLMTSHRLMLDIQLPRERWAVGPVRRPLVPKPRTAQSKRDIVPSVAWA